MKRFTRICLIASLALIVVSCSKFRKREMVVELPPSPPIPNTHWADSIFETLTLREKIGQFFMVSAYSNRDEAHTKEITSLISDYKIGGLVFFQGGPVRQARLTNYYQFISKVPLMIAIDGEWGLGMRLDSTISYPRQMTLGAIKDDRLIYEMGQEIGRQCKRMGIHVNFAPVVDINNNPLNPVISTRSFGEVKYDVARKGIAYMKGMQDAGIMANAKHFPGHGDVSTDSHFALPLINKDRGQMDSLELYPFKALIKEGLGSVMVAHLSLPAYDTTENLASTLSPKVVTDLLKNELGFNGLIFTDALNMKGVSSYYEPGVVDMKAFLAGNDILLCAENVPRAIDEIMNALDSGWISIDEINTRCRKVLLAKQKLGLSNYAPIQMENLYQDLNTPEANLINRKLFESGITVLNNENDIIPVKGLDTLKIASLNIGYAKISSFQRMLSNYAPIRNFAIDRDAAQLQIDTIISQLEKYNLVIISIDNTNNNPAKKFGITDKTLEVVEKINANKRVILDIFANPYSLSYFDNTFDSIPLPEGVIMSYEEKEQMQSLSAQVIFGGISADGRLPINASPCFPLYTGIKTSEPIRLKYSIPEEVGMDSKKMDSIEAIVNEAILKQATPGCQVLVARRGRVIYQESFGYHTYENKVSVKNNDVYDIASVTKIAASIPSLMRLQEQGLLNLNDTLGDIFRPSKGTNKEGLTLREIFAHQAKLQSWIPFYLALIDKKGDLNSNVFNSVQSDDFPYRVAENLYIYKDYPDSMIRMILHSPLKEKKEYVYSDLGYYLLKLMIEEKTGAKLNEYVQHNFYDPLGLSTMGYLPRNRIDMRKIIPTEYDLAFRKQLLQGDVHDPGAAMLGGVGGHAGVFSNSNDLAIMLQMYLNGGSYGGVHFFNPSTIKEYTSCQFCPYGNRRGAGFDKPEMNYAKEGPTCQCVSERSFGHTGFTGAMVWVDPEEELIYIFLSNRVYPDAENKKLIQLSIRTRIQQAIYNSIKR